MFAKSDIQPLLNQGARREDIAASIFQAVVDQTVAGLTQGRELKGKIVFLGGPLHFLMRLRERFVETLKLDSEHAVFPEDGDCFAAMGATSGPLMAREETGSQTVPMFMTMAQYDMWSYDLNQDDTMTTQAVDMWLVRNGLADASNVVEVRKTGATETYVEGRYNNSVWENEDGIPLFRYAWVTGKDHVNLPAENQLLWDEWFSQITLDTETGVRAYQGQAIG